jgi:diguanylate cyclase (GGDEF)-like protein
VREATQFEALVALLRELGVRTLDDRVVDGEAGFPVQVPLAGGGTLVLDLPAPAALGNLDPEGVGVAILDPLGHARRVWGLAQKIPFFRRGQSVLESPIGGLLETRLEGTQGSLYLDGYRYFSAPLETAEISDVFVLIVNAQEERQARRQASKSWRAANALKRLGKALTMNHGTHSICLAASHEVASTTDLAAVLLWTYDSEQRSLELAASVGVNRQGSNAMGKIGFGGVAGCVAELVAASGQPFFLGNVVQHVMTSDLEAKFCYLKPGGLSVHPLVISDKLLGVLELVGKEGDPYFEDNLDLFQTVAEHLALALNSAAMFEHAERWALHDALTGIANHRSLHEFLQIRLVEARRTSSELGVMMIDVDHFRSFNEEEGHDAGDEVLKLVADTLKSCLRPYDLAARYGGEEFTIVMPGCDRASLAAVAERVRLEVESIPYITRSGRERHITVSIGCALSPRAGDDPSPLLKAADTALFQAKRAGRNRIKFHDRSASPHRDSVDLGKLRELIPADDLDASEAMLQRLEPPIESLVGSLRLSPAQGHILQALALLVRTYRRLSSDPELLERFEVSEEFRVLRPSLEAIEERFDGKGKRGLKGMKIPLLGRILAVLLAVDEDAGVPLLDDPARFDPEVVSAFGEMDEAA